MVTNEDPVLGVDKSWTVRVRAAFERLQNEGQPHIPSCCLSWGHLRLAIFDGGLVLTRLGLCSL
jgi:hypothetical protein